MTTATVDTTVATTPAIEPTPKAEPRSTSIALHASGATIRLIAVRKAAGAVTFVVTQEADSKLRQRGCTQDHATFEAATAAIQKMARQAEAAGWSRSTGRVGFARKPDAFTQLPAPPKAKPAKK